MLYQRKTRDVWDIETNYGYGWEVESTYDNKADAKMDFSEYKLHTIYYNAQCRIKHRREKIA